MLGYDVWPGRLCVVLLKAGVGGRDGRVRGLIRL